MTLTAYLIVTLLRLVGLLPTDSLDFVIAKNIEARGGLDNITAVKSLRIISKMTAAPAGGAGAQATVVTEFSRPNAMRMEVTIAGITNIRTWNGISGWELMPMWNIKQPRVISDAVGRDCEWLADFDGPLIDHVLKGHDVQLLGRTRLGSCACFQLRIRLKNGDMVDVYIDSTSFLEICQRITRANGSAVVHFDQYQLVGKLKYPHLVTIDNGAQIQRYTVEHIEINPQLQADRFEHIQP